MLVWNACVLIAAAGFLSEVPGPIRAKLTSTNETCGVFVQTKTAADGRSYVTKGTYRIRPGVDFTWRTLEPFEACFTATTTNYVYSNEDETVVRELSELPGFSRFAGAGEGDFSAFFKAFDALYAEESGKFYVRAKPKTSELKRVLGRVDAEGVVTNWTLRAELADRTVFTVSLREAAKNDIISTLNVPHKGAE